MSNSVLEAMNIRNNAGAKLKYDQHNPHLKEQYKQEKKRVKTIIAESKSIYYHGEFLNNNGNI